MASCWVGLVPVDQCKRGWFYGGDVSYHYFFSNLEQVTTVLLSNTYFSCICWLSAEDTPLP